MYLFFVVSVAEVKRIQKRYSDLMNPSDNILMTKEVMQMPEFRGTPFMDRILHHITPGDKMNFTQFLYLVSVMSIKTPLEEKRKGARTYSNNIFQAYKQQVFYF